MDDVGMRQPLVMAVGSAALQGPRLVMRDTVHLFNPGARHHHVLATEGTASSSPGTAKAPQTLVDFKMLTVWSSMHCPASKTRDKGNIKYPLLI